MFPDRSLTLVDAAGSPLTCVHWTRSVGAGTSSLQLMSGSALPVPKAGKPCGWLPAVRQRKAYGRPGIGYLVRTVGQEPAGAGRQGALFWISDTGVRYGIDGWRDRSPMASLRPLRHWGLPPAIAGSVVVSQPLFSPGPAGVTPTGYPENGARLPTRREARRLVAASCPSAGARSPSRPARTPRVVRRRSAPGAARSSSSSRRDGRRDGRHWDAADLAADALLRSSCWRWPPRSTASDNKTGRKRSTRTRDCRCLSVVRDIRAQAADQRAALLVVSASRSGLCPVSLGPDGSGERDPHDADFLAVGWRPRTLPLLTTVRAGRRRRGRPRTGVISALRGMLDTQRTVRDAPVGLGGCRITVTGDRAGPRWFGPGSPGRDLAMTPASSASRWRLPAGHPGLVVGNGFRTWMFPVRSTVSDRPYLTASPDDPIARIGPVLADRCRRSAVTPRPNRATC